jgi:hypothetical protein
MVTKNQIMDPEEHRMKIRIGVVLFVLMMMMGLPLFAQDNTGQTGRAESEYYYVTVPIERIYTYRLGYVVTYRKGPLGMGQAYVPTAWFGGGSSKAEIVSLNGPGTWPYLLIYYKNREFSHVKLVVREKTHESWGLLPNRGDIDSKFEGVESIQIEFQ